MVSSIRGAGPILLAAQVSRTVFIGHFALGLAAKRATPEVPLWMLFVAAQLADVLWPIFLLLGLEEVVIAPGNTAFTPLNFVSYPYSHSLLLLVAWGLLLGLAVRAVDGQRRRVVLVVAGLVVSHWLLDVVTHRPDMPLYPGGPKFGSSLWNSIAGTLVVESSLFAAGVWLYVRTTRPSDAIGRWAFGALVLVLVAIYVANLMGRPPSVPVLAATATVGALGLLMWTWWVDRHRCSRA